MNALFVAWRSGETHHQGWGPVGRLDYDGHTYRFCYTQGAQTLEGFKAFPEMQELDQIYESEKLFPLFENRLLSPSRPEYEAFLHWSGFNAEDAPDPISVLSVTEGRRQTDSIEVFPCPIPDATGCYLNKFFLHGIRWVAPAAVERLAKLQPGERLLPMGDFHNEYDPNALAVRTIVERTLIGYVPRYLAHDVWDLLNECEREFIKLTVERVNEDAPLQQRVLCRMQSCWPSGFRPCSGPEFQPIPSGVPERCSA